MTDKSKCLHPHLLNKELLNLTKPLDTHIHIYTHRASTTSPPATTISLLTMLYHLVEHSGRARDGAEQSVLIRNTTLTSSCDCVSLWKASPQCSLLVERWWWAERLGKTSNCEFTTEHKMESNNELQANLCRAWLRWKFILWKVQHPS